MVYLPNNKIKTQNNWKQISSNQIMQEVLVPITIIVVNSILMGEGMVAENNFRYGGLIQACHNCFSLDKKLCSPLAQGNPTMDLMNQQEGYQSLGASRKLLKVHPIGKWSGEVISLFIDHSHDLARHKRFKFKNLCPRESPWTKQCRSS